MQENKKVTLGIFLIIRIIQSVGPPKALYTFPPLSDLFIPTPFSASLGSILAMQQLSNDYSLIFPPLSIARYSFIQLSTGAS